MTAPPQRWADILVDEGDFALVRRSARKYPGLVVQGDHLRVLLDALEEAGSPDGTSEDRAAALGEALASVRDAVRAYERMMAAADRSLPYARGDGARGSHGA